MTDAVPVPLAVAPPFASPSPPSVPRVALSSADGSLSFDFAPRVGLQLRLTSWRDGLQLSRFEDGAWEPEPSDPQLIRPADFLARSRGDPLAQFAATLPAEECSLASRFQSWQLTILRLLRCHPAAADLARGTPNLLWLLAAIVDEQELPNGPLADVLGGSRVDVLRFCVGLHATRSTLRFLEKVVAPRRPSGQLEIMRQALSEPEVVAWFRHEPVVTPPDIERVLRTKKYRHLPFFRDAITLERTGQPALSGALATLRDVYRLGEGMAEETLDARVSGCRTVRQLDRLHDNLIAEARRLDAAHQLSLIALRYGTTDLPPAPRAGTSTIEHVATAAELIDEGRAMHHCVASYASSIFAGESAIYRVLAPQRATLELRRIAGRLVAHQLRGACNAEVDDETRAVVDAWLGGG